MNHKTLKFDNKLKINSDIQGMFSLSLLKLQRKNGPYPIKFPIYSFQGFYRYKTYVGTLTPWLVGKFIKFGFMS